MSRSLRRALLSLLVLAVLLGLVDRGGEAVAARVVAARVQRSAGLPERPHVEVRGVPFLTQVLAGRYRDVRVDARGAGGGVPLARLDVRLTGVRLPLRDVVTGHVGAVPVERLEGSGLLSYAQLSARAGHGLHVAPAGDRVSVTGSADVLGATLRVTATSDVRLEGDRVVVRAKSFSSGSGLADRVLDAVLGDRFDLTVPVGGLPYGLRLTGLRVRPDGVELAVRSGPTVLPG